MLLDIGVGILLAMYLGGFLNIQFGIFAVMMGILFALSPDLDFIFAFANDSAQAHRHRDILHYPLLFIPIGFFAVLLVLDYRFAILFAVAAFLHFLHDSIGIGWGVAWFYPFSKNHYAFFYQYDTSHNHLPRRLVSVWSPAEVESLSRQYGGPHWFKNIYLKLSPYAIVELLVFIFALILLILH